MMTGMFSRFSFRFPSSFQHVLVALFLAAICYAAFFNALNNAFMVDDHNVFLWDSRGHNPENLPDQFIPDYRVLRGMKDMAVSQYFRPWAHIIPLVSYAFFQNDPFGYHVFNLVLFYLACLSIYAFIHCLFKDRMVAGLTALFFAVHPVNGLMVNYITASVFSFQIIMTMLGLVAAVRYVDQPRKWGWMVLGLLGFLNGLFCHETGLAFPFYVLVYLWVLRRHPFVFSFYRSLPFWIAAGVYFLVRMKVASLKSSVLENVFFMDINPGTYLAALAKLLAWYFQGLLTFQNIVLIKAVAVTSSGMWLWIAGLIAALAAGLLLIKTFLDSRERFALVWLAVGFLPVIPACFFQYRSGLIFEPHWMVIGCIGYFLFLALMLVRIKTPGREFLMWVVVFLGVTGSLIAGWSYNRLWGNEVQYCLRWMKESPTLRPIPICLGHAYLKEHRLEEAKTYFIKALDGSFFDYELLNNLGGVAMQQEDWTAAKTYFQRALILNPQSSPVHSNLGVVYFNEGADEAAEKSYRQALFFNPYFIDGYKNLTDLYSGQERWAEAVKICEDALAVDPFHQDMMVALVNAYLKTSQTDKIPSLVERLTKLSNDPNLLVNTAVRLAQAGQILPALMCFERSMKMNPDFKEAYLELGKLFGNLNRFDDAIAVWQEGLRRHPEEQLFKRLMDEAGDLKHQTQR